MEAAQRKSKRAKLVISDKYLHAVSLKSLLQSGGYETETREWSKLLEADQTLDDWKTTFCAAKCCKEAFGDGERRRTEPVWGFSTVWTSARRKGNRENREQPTNNVPSDAGLVGGIPG